MTIYMQSQHVHNICMFFSKTDILHLKLIFFVDFKTVNYIMDNYSRHLEQALKNDIDSFLIAFVWLVYSCCQIGDFTARLTTLQDALTEKTSEVKMMQSELKLVKEFRRKRGQMQKELDEVICC